MSKFVTRKVMVCTEHMFYTPADYECSHGDKYLTARYEARSVHPNGDGEMIESRMWRQNGDVAVFKSRSGARHFLGL